MINIKYAFLHLSRRTIMTFLIIIQISAALILLISSVAIKNEINSSINKIDRIFKSQSNILSMTSEGKNPFNVESKEYEKFYNYLKTSNSFKHIYVNDENFFLKPFKGIEGFIKTTKGYESNGEKYSIVNSISLEYEALKYFNLRVNSGRTFTNEDFSIKNSKSVPILLGEKYSRFFKLGDEIETLQNGKNVKARVAGFLEKNSYIVTANNPEKIIVLDNYIIYPYQGINLEDKNIKEEDKVFYLYNNIFESINVIDNKNIGDSISAKEEILNKSEEIGISLRVNSVSDKVQGYKNGFEESRKITLILFIILFLFAAVGFSTSILYSINKRVKEFGVHLMIGATTQNIVLMVMYEIFIVVISSYGIAITYMYCFQKKYLGINTLIETSTIVAALFVLLSILPVVKVIKLDINQLVKGNE